MRRTAGARGSGAGAGRGLFHTVQYCITIPDCHPTPAMPPPRLVASPINHFIPPCQSRSSPVHKSGRGGLGWRADTAAATRAARHNATRSTMNRCVDSPLSSRDSATPTAKPLHCPELARRGAGGACTRRRRTSAPGSWLCAWLAARTPPLVRGGLARAALETPLSARPDDCTAQCTRTSS